jgi:hypothetical protein
MSWIGKVTACIGVKRGSRKEESQWLLDVMVWMSASGLGSTIWKKSGDF